MATLGQLSDEQKIRALTELGRVYVLSKGRPAEPAARELQTFLAGRGFEPSDLPATTPEAARAATAALEVALADPDLNDEAQAIIDEVAMPGVELSISAFAVGGLILLGLAVVAKLEYNKKEGWKLNPGLPDAEAAGRAMAALASGSISPPQK